MTAAEMFRQWKVERHQQRLTVTGDLLSYLAIHVQDMRLENGARVLDSSDFREFLAELATLADEELK